jgi:hypothetical protein
MDQILPVIIITLRTIVSDTLLMIEIVPVTNPMHDSSLEYTNNAQQYAYPMNYKYAASPNAYGHYDGRFDNRYEQPRINYPHYTGNMPRPWFPNAPNQQSSSGVGIRSGVVLNAQQPIGRRRRSITHR